MLRPKKSPAEWVNACAPSQPIPLETTMRNLEVILIDLEVANYLDDWLSLNWELFKWRLNDWHTDPTLWPQSRTQAMFRDWFEVELAESVVDLAALPFVHEP